MSEQEMVTGDPVSRSARAAARRLAATHGARLEPLVENALYSRETNQVPDRYVDPVSVASLVVSTAALAWTVYKDLRTNALKPAKDNITKRVQDELPASDPISPEDRDKIIKVVVEEFIKDTEE